MRKESATIRRCHSQLSALGLDSDAVFHRSKLILKIYRDVVWVLSERVEELQEYAWDLGKQDIDTGLCYLENFAPDIDLQDFEEKVCCVVESRMFVEIIDRALLRLRKYPDRGELYYEILTKQFIYRFNSTEKEMLEELFLFAKLKNDAYRLELEPCCFSNVLKETVFSYYDEWKKRGLRPEIEIPGERLHFMGNEQALKRMIQNVIKNGLDHGENKIGIRLRRQEGMLCMEISNQTDNPEQIDISRVFERFYKADGARSRTSSGLGLSIARELSVRMGGEMSAGIRGSEFWIEAKFPEIQV